MSNAEQHDINTASASTASDAQQVQQAQQQQDAQNQRKRKTGLTIAIALFLIAGLAVGLLVLLFAPPRKHRQRLRFRQYGDGERTNHRHGRDHLGR